MRGYGRYEDEDLDEYEEEDGEEQEEVEGGEDDYEEEEIYQPTQEELEYLELRQRLKESIRKQMKKELGTANAGSSDKLNASRRDSYGSFFGPSQPVIAPRVIQESKSLLENPDLAARISKSNHTNKKVSASSTVGSKPQANYLPKVTNGLKKKVEMLKNTRDYSFLSDDSEVPAPMKNPLLRTTSAPKLEARSAPLAKSIQGTNYSRREVSNSRDERKQTVASSQSRPRVGTNTHTSKLSVDSRKKPASNVGSGPGRPLGPKGLPSRSPAAENGKKAIPPVAKSYPSTLPKPTSSSLQPGARKTTAPNVQSGSARRIDSRPQLPVLSKVSVPRKEYQDTGKPKVIPKRPLPSSASQVKRPPSRDVAEGRMVERSRAKPGCGPFDDDDDPDEAMKMLRRLTGYDPNKYRDDDDDSDMEANFDEIIREERRSAKIAQKEDEEQLRLLEEEERRRKAKKRKLSH